jgi:hypothetical protein
MILLNSATLGRMHARVKRLRQHGARLSHREISNAPEMQGDLTLAGLGAGHVLELQKPDVQTEAGLVARLYEARLVTMHGDKMLFRGEERPHGDDGPAFVQEWAVVVTA